MAITIEVVKSRIDLWRYIHLPSKIHKNHPQWVPPLYIDEWRYYNPKKNHSFSHCDTILLLAYKDRKLAGRIMGIINHRYNERKNEKHARFNFLEVWNDQEVAHVLLSYIENWARQKGMDKLIGPFGFSDKDPQGYLIKGFEEKGIFSNHHNYEYLINILEKEGYTKEIDIVSYRGEIPSEMPELSKRIFDRVKRNNPDLTRILFTKRKQVKLWIKPGISLINKTFTDIYGFEEISEQEMEEFANRYLIFIDPKYVGTVVDKENKPVTFFIGMADISDGIRKCKGYIFPFGIFNILKAAKQSKMVVFLLGSVDPYYRNRGIDLFLANRMIEWKNKYGMEFFDSNYELENNTSVRAVMEKLGGKVHKQFRIFQKSLVD